MNMLQIQDALKNASDAQLAQEMQNPSGSAPQFLVLSEMKRRRDMRAAAPEQAPQGTVADELLAQDDGGIRDIVAPDEPEAQDPEDMAAGGIVGLRRMREGGVVHMADGGSIDPNDPNLTQAQRDWLRLRQAGAGAWNWLGRQSQYEGEVRSRTPSLTPGGAAYNYLFTPQGAARTSEQERQFLEQNRSRFMNGELSMEQFRSNPSAYMAANAAAPTTPAPGAAAQRPATAGGESDLPPAQQDEGNDNLPLPPEPPPGGPPRAAGIPGAVVASRGAAAPAQTAQTPQAPARSQTDDRLERLYGEIERNRTNAADRRGDAVNMALIEAGLRIAGSQSPHLAAAISEGATPALQSYNREQQQIRQDQRQDTRDQLQTLLAQNQQEYYRGRISIAELGERNRMAIAEMESRDRAAARAASGGRQITWEQYQRATPEQREQMDRFQGRGRNQDLVQTMNAFSSRLSDLAVAEQRALQGQNGPLTEAQRRDVEARFRRERQNLSQLYSNIDPRFGSMAEIPSYTPGANGAPGSWR